MKEISKQLSIPLIKLLSKALIPIFMTIILNYTLCNIFNNLNDDTLFYLPIFCFCLCLSIFLKIYNSYIRKKDKIKNKDIKNYRRDFDDILSPLLAEALVNQKIDIKELVMTQIIELKLKGNIKIINNEKIELIHQHNLQNHEKCFIRTFFESSNQIYFKEINKLFKTSSTFVHNFSEFVDLYKKNISNSLRNKELIDLDSLKTFNNIRLISYLIISYFPFNFFFFSEGVNIESIFGCLLFSFISFCIIDIVAKNFIKYDIEFVDISYNLNFSYTPFFWVYGLMFPFVLNFFSIIILTSSQFHSILFILYFFTLILNLIILLQKPSLILNQNGINERKKLLELKKYIIDYSLIKNRDLDSIIIWDEFLVYAIAFGIPSKIVSKIYEDWYTDSKRKFTLFDFLSSAFKIK